MVEEFVCAIVEDEDACDQCCGVEADIVPIHDQDTGCRDVYRPEIRLCGASEPGKVGRAVLIVDTRWSHDPNLTAPSQQTKMCRVTEIRSRLYNFRGLLN